MLYSLLAYLIAITHFGFISFVLFGGLLLPRWSWVAWVHIPCAVYAVMIMVVGWRCPLTDLEIHLHKQAGSKVLWDEFLHHYIWSHIGWSGGEWFIVAGLVVVIVLFNWSSYQAILT